LAIDDVVITRTRTEFMAALAEAIYAAGGAEGTIKVPSPEQALPHAELVWERLKQIGEDEFPCLTRHLGLQFVCQWDQHPPLLTVMVWVERMWQDTRRIVVPNGA
jgi:hypothetical protein